VDEATIGALERLRASGRRLVMVTGRQLADLMLVFPRTELFDRVVVENGAVVYRPFDGTERTLAEPPPEEFIASLRRRDVSPLSAGRVIVATSLSQKTVVSEVIRELDIDLRVILNKGGVMVLPSGVDKATGMDAALTELGLLPGAAVGVGDAENDQALLARCGCSVAVANALVSLKEQADLVTAGERGAGIVELIGRMLQSDLAELEPRRTGHISPLVIPGRPPRSHGPP
jgi:hypothetical protein